MSIVSRAGRAVAADVGAGDPHESPCGGPEWLGDRSGSSAHQLQASALLVLIEAAGLCQSSKFVAGVDALEAA